MRTTVLEAAAWVVLDGSRGSLASQLDRIEWHRPLPEPAQWPDSPGRWDDEPVRFPEGLLFRQRPGRIHRRRPRVLPLDRAPPVRMPAGSTASRAMEQAGSRSCRRRPGSTSSPTPTSDSWSPRAGRGSPGRETARPTASPPGATTRSPTRPRKSSISATSRPAKSGARHPCPSLLRLRRWCATARDIRSSSGTRTASPTS